MIGIDYSQAFVDTCQHLKDQGSRVYFITDEGALTTSCAATVQPSIVSLHSKYLSVASIGIPICRPSSTKYKNVVTWDPMGK